MRIAVLEGDPNDGTATGERGRAIVGFLRRRGHEVDVLAPDVARLRDFSRFRFSLWSRLKRRALRHRTLPHLWDFVADELETRLGAGRYDAVIARSPLVAGVLTRSIPGVKIVDVANITFLEIYHGAAYDTGELVVTHEKERDVYAAADWLLLPHPLLADFFRRHVLDHPKVVTVRLGCHFDPAARPAEYRWPPRIVYAGSYGYIQDPYLLSLLSRQSPWPIDCYGRHDPNFAFLPQALNYCGFSPNTSFLARYQAGLITVSADRLRRHSPATKFAYYFAAGLPVLFPAWMKEGHGYPAAVAYDEGDFVERARWLLEDENRWTSLSRAARETAQALDWERVLEPLLGLLGRPAPDHGVPPGPAVGS